MKLEISKSLHFLYLRHSDTRKSIAEGQNNSEDLKDFEEIVNRVNLHEELIEAFEEFLNCNPDALTRMNHLRVKSLLLIKRAKENN